MNKKPYRKPRKKAVGIEDIKHQAILEPQFTKDKFKQHRHGIHHTSIN